MLKFAGYPAAQLTPRLRSILERWLDQDAPDLWTFPEYQASPAAYLPFPSQPNAEKPKLNTLIWPSGASRWGVFHGIWDGDSAAAIQAACGTDSPVTQTLHLESDDSTAPLTPSMGLLAVRPLYALGAVAENLNLLTLVDARYYWWLAQQEYTFTPGDSWTTLLTNLVTSASALPPTVPTIPGAYGSPAPLRWTNPGCPLPPLIDAAASTVGLRFLYNLDGTCEFQTAADAATADLARWNQNRANLVQGGFMRATDVAGNVPLAVAVGFWGDTPDITTTTLASLSLPDYGMIVGVAGTYAWIAGDRYAGQTSPTAASYATQAATDYYGWALALTDATFRGICNTAVTGFDDRIEWEYCPAIPCEAGDDGGDVLNQRLPDVRVCTRIVPFPFTDRNVYGTRAPAGYTYPVRLTAVSGGVYKAVTRTTATGSVADGPKVGFGADSYLVYPATGTPSVGDYGTAVPDPLVPGKWLFVPASASPPPPPAPGCGAAAGWQTTDCIRVTPSNPSGACSEIDTAQRPILTYSSGTWVGTVATDAGDEDAQYWLEGGTAHFSIGDVEALWLGCSGSGLLFSYYGPVSCTITPTTPCGDNTVTFLLECVCCPDPDWTTAGWYCVVNPAAPPAIICVEILTQPCVGDYEILSGPHASEGDCEGLCDPTDPCDYIAGPNVVAFFTNVSGCAAIDGLTVTFNTGTGAVVSVTGGSVGCQAITLISFDCTTMGFSVVFGADNASLGNTLSVTTLIPFQVEGDITLTFITDETCCSGTVHVVITAAP